MPVNKNCPNITLTIITIVFGVIALILACVGIAMPNWQSSQAYIGSQRWTISTANFFFACRLNLIDSTTNCISRSSNRSINQYYPIDARWNETEWNQHLDAAAGLSIVGIIFIFIGTLTNFIMLADNLRSWLYLIGPVSLFLACLFMLAGMAEGAFVLYYNDYAANLYQTAHLLTIFNLLLSCITAGRVFSFPRIREFDIPLGKR